MIYTSFIPDGAPRLGRLARWAAEYHRHDRTHPLRPSTESSRGPMIEDDAHPHSGVEPFAICTRAGASMSSRPSGKAIGMRRAASMRIIALPLPGRR